MGVGVAVGIAVNFLVFAPLHFNAAATSLGSSRRLTRAAGPIPAGGSTRGMWILITATCANWSG